MAETKENKGILGWLSRMTDIEGDKVIMMIAVLLITIGLLAVSSSTPLLALESHTTRGAIIQSQLFLSAACLGIIFGIYKIRNISIFRTFASLGFFFSFCMLVFLDLHVNLGIVKAAPVNGAWRIISVAGFQVHVYELVKLLMVMYVAWALESYAQDRFRLSKVLAEKFEFLKGLGTKTGEKWFYIYGPILITGMLIMPGSNSSMILITGVMAVMVAISGVVEKLWKDALIIASIGIIAILFGLSINKASGGKYLGETGRIETAIERFMRKFGGVDKEEKLVKLKADPKEREYYWRYVDTVKQEISAKIAVSEGGIIGKGPGGSSQRFVTSVMFGDYMFSFLVEEYGLIGALFVLVLYGSLLARGSIVARACDSTFSKAMIAGFVIMISGQAMLHILVDVDLIPMTGQTLPLVSHGKSAAIAFSMMFGVMLSLSRMAKKKVDEMTSMAQPIVEKQDDIRDSMSALDDLESENID